MATRLHRISTIFDRTNTLLKKGMLENAKPIWFDVYKAFPPKYEPTYKRKATKTDVKEIFYKEDVLRAKLHKALDDKVGLFNLASTAEFHSEKILNTCQKYVSEGFTEDEAVRKAIESVKN